MPDPPLEPGIKQIHMLLLDVVNPAPGWYAIGVVAETGPQAQFEVGSGFVRILPKPRASVGFTSALFMPGGLNAVLQRPGRDRSPRARSTCSSGTGKGIPPRM